MKKKKHLRIDLISCNVFVDEILSPTMRYKAVEVKWTV